MLGGYLVGYFKNWPFSITSHEYYQKRLNWEIDNSGYFVIKKIDYRWVSNFFKNSIIWYLVFDEKIHKHLIPLVMEKKEKKLANSGLKFKSHPHWNSAPKKSKEKELSQDGLSYHTYKYT
jgi:hypothetical protein